MIERLWLNIIYSAITGVVIGSFGGQAFITRSNYIPKIERVQQGYAVPNKLEIKLEDLDGNGEKETIMRYDGKSYLLRLDNSGKPSVQAYSVKPAEVVPKTE